MSGSTIFRRYWPWFTAAIALLIAAVVVTVIVLVGAPQSDPVAEPKAKVEHSAPTTTPPPVTETPEVSDVTIDEVQEMPYSPVWNPPDQGEGFWQIVDPEHGYPADGGTDYVLAHACPDRSCAGDDLRTLKEGEEFDYLGDAYTVEQMFEISKDEIADQDIWDHVPGRLVVVTCIIDPETGLSLENDIIVAEPAK